MVSLYNKNVYLLKLANANFSKAKANLYRSTGTKATFTLPFRKAILTFIRRRIKILIVLSGSVTP